MHKAQRGRSDNMEKIIFNGKNNFSSPTSSPKTKKSRKKYFKEYRKRMKANVEYLTRKRERENKGRERKFYYYIDIHTGKPKLIKNKKAYLKLKAQKPFLTFLCKTMRSGIKITNGGREQWDYA